MTSTPPTTTEGINEPQDAEEGQWLNVSPKFNTAMMKGLETGTFEDSTNGKTVDMDKAREAGIASSGVNFLPLSQLRDIQGRPVVYGKRYLFREAGRERDRMTDFENNNLRRVVNNAKWHDGIYLKIHRKYRQHEHIFEIEYPGRGKWLGGTHAQTGDVTLHNNRPTSVWMFEDQGKDSHGWPCYAIWAEQWGATDFGNGFWLPDYSISRAGYDGDWEWRMYDYRAKEGWFNIMFERVDYNE